MVRKKHDSWWFTNFWFITTCINFLFVNRNPPRCSLQLSEFLARKWDEASGGSWLWWCLATTERLNFDRWMPLKGHRRWGPFLTDENRAWGFGQIFRELFWGFGSIFRGFGTVVLQKIGLSTPSERRVNSRRSDQSFGNFPYSNWSEGSHVGRARLRCGQHRFYGFYIVLWIGTQIQSEWSRFSRRVAYWLLIDSYAFLKAIISIIQWPGASNWWLRGWKKSACPRLDVQAPEATITSRQDAALEMINVKHLGFCCVKYVCFVLQKVGKFQDNHPQISISLVSQNLWLNLGTPRFQVAPWSEHRRVGESTGTTGSGRENWKWDCWDGRDHKITNSFRGSNNANAW